jgi:glutathione S-transferase
MRTEFLWPRLDVFEHHLAERRWLAGGEFTLADLHVASMLTRPPVPRVETREPNALPHTHNWFEACVARPAFTRMAHWRATAATAR